MSYPLATSGPLHILLADDDEDDREFFRQALTNINSQAVLSEVHNGCEAVRYVKSMTPPPDFVFLDINMPLVNGIECLREIRKLYSKEQLPVFMLSTSGAPNVVRESIEAGASRYIRKPSTLEDLKGMVQFCLTSEGTIEAFPFFI